MAEYNPQELQKYFDNRDWQGAANYLKTIPLEDTEKSNLARIKINNLERKANKVKGLLQGVSPEIQQAYHFASALEGEGTIPFNDDNIYGKNYTNYVNNLKVNQGVSDVHGNDISGKDIDKIRLRFINDDALNAFYNTAGITNDNIHKLGVDIGEDATNGSKFIDISLDNTQLTFLVNNMLETFGQYGLGKNMYKSLPWKSTNDLNNEKAYTDVVGITSDNAVVHRDDFNFPNIIKATNIVNKAKDEKRELLNNKQSFDEKLYITPFISLGDANAFKAMQKGLINIDDYNKVKEMWKKHYDNLLQANPFNDKNVYMSYVGERDEYRLTPVEDKNKADIRQALLLAIQDNRVSYREGIFSGREGTFITILPKDNKQSSIQGYNIFIENFFDQGAYSSFEHDTETMAMRDNADMRRWNYGRFLKDGNYVGYDKDFGAYKLINTEFGEQIKQQIGEDEMLQLLHRDVIVNETVGKLMQNVDKDGKPLEYTDKNGQKKKYNLEEKAYEIATVATDELYPLGVYTEGQRAVYQSDIFQDIINILYQTIYNIKKKD